MIVMLPNASIYAAYEDGSGGGNIAHCEPCYCMRRPQGNWRVTQIVDETPVTFLVDDSKIEAFERCDSAVVKGSDSLETKSGGAHMTFIVPDSILRDIRYPDDYFGNGSSVTFSFDGKNHEAFAEEFRAKTRPISN